MPGPIYISFSAEINQTTTEGLLSVCAQKVNEKVEEINLLFSTAGGAVINGINLYNVLRAMPFKLIVYNVGSVNSIGNVVFLAGDERYASPTSSFMFHGVGFDITQTTRLEEKLLRERLDAIASDQSLIASIIAERTNIDAQEVSSLFLEASTKDATFAKEKGIVDDIRDVQIPKGATVLQLAFKR